MLIYLPRYIHTCISSVLKSQTLSNQLRTVYIYRSKCVNHFFDWQKHCLVLLRVVKTTVKTSQKCPWHLGQQSKQAVDRFWPILLTKVQQLVEAWFIHDVYDPAWQNPQKRTRNKMSYWYHMKGQLLTLAFQWWTNYIHQGIMHSVGKLWTLKVEIQWNYDFKKNTFKDCNKTVNNCKMVWEFNFFTHF